MAQYKTGTVDVDNDQTGVIGHGTNWSSELSAGHYFSIQNENVWYEILSVDSDVHLTLKTNYSGNTKSGALYAVQRDFTPNQNYAIPSYGDTNVSSLLKETFLKLDSYLASFSPLNTALSGDLSLSGDLDIEIQGNITSDGHVITPGVAGGVATLDSSGKVPSSQLAISALLDGVASGAILPYETLALLNADLAHADGIWASVIADDSNNGVYKKSGASGSGSWIKKSDIFLGAVSRTDLNTEIDARVAAVAAEATARVTNQVDFNSVRNLLAHSDTFTDGAWSKINTTVAAITEASPTGSYTISQIIDNSANNLHAVNQNTSEAGAHSAGTRITASIYAKANSLSQVALWITNSTDAAKQVVFDLRSGVVFSRSSSNIFAGLVALPDFPGWYRCWLTITLDSDGYPGLFVMTAVDGAISYAGTGAGSVYIAGAMVSVGDSLHPYVDSATSAGSKNIARSSEITPATYAAILANRTDYHVVQNLFTKSNDFSDTAWTNINSSTTPVSLRSPASGSIVYRLADDSINNLHAVNQNTSSAGGRAAGSKVTFSIYAMADSLSQIVLWATNGTDVAKLAIFDLLSGQEITRSSSELSAGLVALPDFPGWYRCWLTITLDSDGYPGLFVMTAVDGAISYAGTGGTIYLAGAMANVGSELSPYIDSGATLTANNIARNSEISIPTYAAISANRDRIDRVDESLVKTTSLSTTVNFLLQSDDFGTAPWSRSEASVTPGALPAPRGKTFASKLNETAATNFHMITQSFGSVAAGTVITFSIYAKAGERSQITGWFKAQNDDPKTCMFDLSAGTAVPDGGPQDCRIIPVDGIAGWYRCVFTVKTATAGTHQIFWMIANDNQTSYFGDPTKGIYIAHAAASFGCTLYDFAPTLTLTATARPTIFTGADRRRLNYISGNTTGYALLDDEPTLYIVASDSQSNAAGSGSDSLIATSPLFPGRALMGSTGVHSQGQRFTTLVDLVESIGSPSAYRETAGSGWINGMLTKIAAQSPFSTRFAYFNPAIGGRTITELKRGGPSYYHFLAALQDMVDAARRAGYRPVFLALDWMGNESATYGNGGEWPNQLKQLRRQMDEDIRRITGQTEHWVMFLSYVRTAAGVSSSFTGYPFWNPVFTGNRQAAMMDPYIKLAVPTYQFPSNDIVNGKVHMNNVGQNRRGQALAEVVFAEMFGAGWTEFRDSRIWRSGEAEITVYFQLPRSANLVLDTSGTIVPNTGYPAGNYFGFRFADGSNAPPLITGHSFAGPYMMLTLSGPPSGHAGQLAYATETVGSTEDVAGCLRSDFSYPLLYGLGSDYDWCLPFITDFAI